MEEISEKHLHFGSPLVSALINHVVNPAGAAVLW